MGGTALRTGRLRSPHAGGPARLGWGGNVARSLSDLAAQLRQAGVPEPVVGYAMTDGVGRATYYIASFAAVAAFIGGIIGVVSLGQLPAAWNAQSALAAAQASGGILFHVNFGISTIILLFASIFIFGSLIGLIPLVSDRLLKTAFVYFVADAGRQAATRYLLRWSLRRAAGETDPHRYIRIASTAWARPVGIVGLALTAIGVVVCLREVQSFSVFTPTAYLPSPLLPWASREPLPWSDAVSVATGCSHVVTKHDTSDAMVYDVTFADGTTADLGRATPVQGRWIDAAEVVDRAVTEGGATFAPRTPRLGEPYSPACIEAVWRRMPPLEFERIARMLRFPQ